MYKNNTKRVKSKEEIDYGKTIVKENDYIQFEMTVSVCHLIFLNIEASDAYTRDLDSTKQRCNRRWNFIIIRKV